MKNLEKQYPLKKRVAPEIPNQLDALDTEKTPVENFHVEIGQPIEGEVMETPLAAQNNVCTAMQVLAPTNANQGLLMPMDLVDTYTQKTLKLLVRTVEDILELGRLINEAKHKLTAIHYYQYCKAIGFEKNRSTVCKYEAIGDVADELLPHASILPNCWTSVYLLSMFDMVTLKRLLDDGKITPDITGSSIRKLIKDNHPPKSSGKNTSAHTCHYKCSMKLDMPIDEEMQRELDELVGDYISRMKIRRIPIQSQLEGGQ